MQSPVPIPTWYPGLTHEQLVNDPIEVELGETSLAALENINVTVETSGGLTNTELRAAPVPVNGTVELGMGSLSALENITVTGPLTDAQLRAGAVNVAPNVTRGPGSVDSNTQRITLATDGPGVANLSNISTGVGLPTDTVASSDTGTFGVISFIKRGLQNWTTLLSRVPALVSGRIPVDASGTTIATTDTLNGTRSYNWAVGTREPFPTTSTAALPLPALGARREARFVASAGCFVRFGDSALAAATVGAGQAIFPADCPEVIVIPVGHTHYRVIGETASGSIAITPVV